MVKRKGGGSRKGKEGKKNKTKLEVIRGENKKGSKKQGWILMTRPENAVALVKRYIRHTQEYSRTHPRRKGEQIQMLQEIIAEIDLFLNQPRPLRISQEMGQLKEGCMQMMENLTHPKAGS